MLLLINDITFYVVMIKKFFFEFVLTASNLITINLHTTFDTSLIAFKTVSLSYYRYYINFNQNVRKRI